MAKGKNQHVVPHRDGGWAVKGEGRTKATSVHGTQREAISAAREIARNQNSEIIIHRPNGQIRDHDIQGSDPFPPRSREQGIGRNLVAHRGPDDYMSMTTSKSEGTKALVKTKSASIDAPLWEEFLRAARRQNRNASEELNNFMRECLEIWDDQELDEQIQRDAQATGYQEEDAVELVRRYRKDKDEQRASA